MEIWLDTINLDIIADAMKTGIIFGVTTNPSILSHSPNPSDTIKSLLDLQPGPVAVQVTSHDVESIIEEARAIFEFSPRMIVKIPVNSNGLIAMNELKKDQFPILGTAVLSPIQALLAAHHDVNYIAPYFSHMGEKKHETLETMRTVLKGSKTKILAASLKNVDDIISCALLGLEAITLKAGLYQEFIRTPSSLEQFLDKFSNDWNQTHTSIKDLSH